MRKIIQIEDCPDTANSQGYLMALCDDGSVWTFSNGSWSRFPDIPQDEPQK